MASASALLCIAAGWALIGLALLVAFEVFARKFFAFSTQGADEIGGYVLAISAAAAFSYGIMTRSHIRIDLVLRHLPVRLQAGLNILAFATLNIFAWMLAWQAVGVALQSLRLEAAAPTPLATPLIIPQGIWSLAIGFFAVICALRLLEAVRGLLRGQWQAVAREFGPVTVTEDVHIELTSARRRLGAPASHEDRGF